jgi:hypothetical protein
MKSKGPRFDLWETYIQANINLTKSVINYIEFCNIKEENRFRVFENRLQRRIFGLERDEETGGLRRLHNEELHNLHSSPNIIRMIKSLKIKRAGHVACSMHEGNEKCIHYFSQNL